MVVVERMEDYISPKGKYKTKWKCRCDCGNEVGVTSSAIHRGQQSCGCDKYKRIREKRLIDLIGKRFGKLTLLQNVSSTKWECKCDCGNITVVDGSTLRCERTKSCGCLKMEKPYSFE